MFNLAMNTKESHNPIDRFLQRVKHGMYWIDNQCSQGINPLYIWVQSGHWINQLFLPLRREQSLINISNVIRGESFQTKRCNSSVSASIPRCLAICGKRIHCVPRESREDKGVCMDGVISWRGLNLQGHHLQQIPNCHLTATHRSASHLRPVSNPTSPVF